MLSPRLDIFISESDGAECDAAGNKKFAHLLVAVQLSNQDVDYGHLMNFHGRFLKTLYVSVTIWH